MMKRILLYGLILFGCAATLQADEQAREDNAYVVVVNENSVVTQLSQKQVMSLFLGRSQFLPGGSRVKTFDFPVDSPIRAEFYQSLTGKNIATIDAYWARLRYSGRATPPQALADSQAIIQKLGEHDTGLGYLPSDFESSLADNGLKAVLTMRNP